MKKRTKIAAIATGLILMSAPLMAEGHAAPSGGIDPFMIFVLLVIVAGTGGAAAPASSMMYAVAASDRRLKENIKKIRVAENGLTIYQYSYKGCEKVYEGVMAQDVLGHTPEAVTIMSNGFFAVNYDMLGLEMREIA